MRKVYSHLSAEERVRIDELRNRDGLGVRQIVLRIGRDKSTVSREPGRGLWFTSSENESHRPYRPKRLKAGAWTSRPFYSAMTAQRKAERRARQLRKPMRMAYDPLLERQAAQGIGPQAVPASGQAASHARQGQEVEGAAHPDARADRRTSRTRGPAPRVRPL